MPPKKPNEPSKKTEIKKKEKIVEDKTFGLKNKKGSKQQKFIQQVHHQVVQQGKTAKQLEKDKLDKLSKKDEKKKTVEELNALFKPVEQKVAKGTDPKSVLCAFFKAGQCTKGDKCKFSHDLSIGRKAEKRSMYDDQREGDNETMADWDEAKLEEVVHQKHAESDSKQPKTDIICKFFLEAVESSKYGWFWSCPNGDTCKYRHALPPGFVLKKDQKKENKEDLISLEDLIEKERAALSSQNLTKVTLETFLKWKDRKKRERAEKAMEESEKKKANYSAGKMFGISGRELFEFNPDLIQDDEDDDDGGAVYKIERRDDEDADMGPVREIDFTTFDEDSSTYCPSDPLPESSGARSRTAFTNGTSSADDDDLDRAAGAVGGASNAYSSSATDEGGTDPRLPYNSPDIADDDDIDENLFDGEDLDIVEEQLDNLEVID